MKHLHYMILAVGLTGLLAFAGCSVDDNPMDMNGQNTTVTVQTTPADGATNVPRGTSFTVTFNRAMDTTEAGTHFMLHEGWGVGMMDMEGHMEWNGDRNRMTFHPMDSLAINTTYTMHISGMMRGMDGMMYSPMFDSAMSGGGMMSGRMMGGMMSDEIRITCSTGPAVRQTVDLNLIGDVVFVAEGGSGDVAVIDPATNALLGIQPIANVKFLHHLSLSPDRTRLLVADPGEDLASGGGGGHGGGHGGMTSTSRIVILDSRTLLEVNRLQVEGVVHNAAVTTNGTSLLFANASHNTVHRYNYPALTSLSSYAVGSSPLEVTLTSDGQYALSANSGNGTVSRIHLTMEMASDVLPVGQTPVGAWISPDGATAWVTNEGSKSITVLTITPFAVDTTIALGFTPGQAFVNPVRMEAYVADEDNGRVVIYDSQTYARLGEIATGQGAHGIAFSPDGMKAFVTNEHAMSVTVIDTYSQTVAATVSVGMKPNGVVYRQAL